MLDSSLYWTTTKKINSIFIFPSKLLWINKWGRISIRRFFKLSIWIHCLVLEKLYIFFLQNQIKITREIVAKASWSNSPFRMSNIGSALCGSLVRQVKGSSICTPSSAYLCSSLQSSGPPVRPDASMERGTNDGGHSPVWNSICWRKIKLKPVCFKTKSSVIYAW